MLATVIYNQNIWSIETIASQFGMANAIAANLAKNPDMYVENALYGEMSKQQSMNAKIDTLGGIDKAVGFDVASASVKAQKDKSVLEGEIESALNKAGIKGEEAKELAKAIVEGSKLGSEEFKKALSELGKYTHDKVAMQTTKDMANVGAWSEFINSPEAINKVLDKLSKHMDISNLSGKNGLDFLSALSQSNALRFYGQNSIVGKDGKVFNGALTADGEVSGSVRGGLNEVIDNSFKRDDGIYYKGQMRREVFNRLKEYYKSQGYSDEEATEKAKEAFQMYDSSKEALQFGKDIAAAYGINKLAGDPLGKVGGRVLDKFSTIGKNVRKKMGLSTKNESFQKAHNSGYNGNNYKGYTQNSKSINHGKPPHNDFKSMGGLAGNPPSKFENIINNSKRAVKNHAREIADDVLKYGSKAARFASRAVPLATAAMAVYEANEKYHEYRDKGYSITDAFIRSGIDTIGSVLTFGLVDNLSDKFYNDNPKTITPFAPSSNISSSVATAQNITPHDAAQSVTAQIIQAQQMQNMNETLKKRARLDFDVI